MFRPAVVVSNLCHLAAVAAVTLVFGACASAGTGSGTGPTDGTLSVTNRSPSGSQARFQIEMTNDPSIRETTLDAPVDDVWTVLPLVFSALEIEAPFQNIVTYEFGNPEFTPRRIEGRRLSNYLDCGNVVGGSRANTYRVAMRFIVRLSSADDGTRARTTVDAYASPRDVSGSSVHCTSRGTLEKRFAQLVMERLGSVQ